eukprot:790085_1
MQFESYVHDIQINGPFSTSCSHYVALNFTDNKGMLIELQDGKLNSSCCLYVVHLSPGKPCKSRAPLSTLMPGITPALFNTSTNGLPSIVFWNKVSSNNMTPQMYLPMSGVVNSNSLY